MARHHSITFLWYLLLLPIVHGSILPDIQHNASLCDVDVSVGDTFNYTECDFTGQPGWLIQMDDESSNFIWNYTAIDYESLGNSYLQKRRGISQRQSGDSLDTFNVYISPAAAGGCQPILVAAAQRGCLDDAVNYSGREALNSRTEPNEVGQSGQVNLYSDRKCKTYSATIGLNYCYSNLYFLSLLPFFNE